MRRAGVLVVVIASAACGADAPPSTATAPVANLAGDLVDPGAGAGDTIVARVDGRPIWASCVTGHVRARAVTVDQALADCIDLELMAAEAVRRGLLADHDHQAALRTALVDRFVAEEFEDVYRTPADIPAPAIDRYARRRPSDLQRQELRTLAYGRALVPRGTLPGSPEDLAAKKLAEDIYAELGARDDLYTWDVRDIGRRIAAGRKYEFKLVARGGLQEDFGRAAYAVPGIGQISPPTRTPWGWDLILVVDLVPARTWTPEQLIASDPPGLVRWFFDSEWTAAIATKFAIEKFPERLADEAPAP